MKMRPLIIAFCCSTVLLLGQFPPLFAQCEILGEVVDGSVNGGCGILLQDAQNGSLYEPIDDLYDLQPGQLITFSIDSVTSSQNCANAIPIVLTCFELVNDVCSASFMYTYLDSQTVLFFNNAQGYTECEWDFGNGPTTSFGDTMSFVKTFESGTARVCLKVWNESGCQDELCLDIAPDAPEEMCNATTCIWPGDTDGDGIANNFDLLTLGLGIGSHGSARPFYPEPDNPIAWAPNFGFDWSTWVGPINYKHLDCDGDGLIDDLDIEAIHQNYTPDFDFESTTQPGAPPIFIEFDQSTIVIDDTTPDFIGVTASIYLGSEALPFINLHGLAFNISYPHEFAVANGITTDIDDNSFLGNSTDLINFSHDLYQEGIGRYDAALSLRNGQGRSGFGKVATVNLVVNSDIIEGLAVPETPFDIIMEQVTMINADGHQISFGLEEDESTITFINSKVAGTTPIDPNQLVKIFPNPAKETLYINMERIDADQAELINAMGQRVWSESLKNTSQIQLNVSSYEPGVYFFRVVSVEGQFSKKVIIE